MKRLKLGNGREEERSGGEGEGEGGDGEGGEDVSVARISGGWEGDDVMGIEEGGK